MGMKKVNTRGIAGAGKHVLMASLCYNLQKLLKFRPRTVETVALKMQTGRDRLAENFNNVYFACFGSFSAQIGPCFSVRKNLPSK
jgi:hypothetical protein